MKVEEQIAKIAALLGDKARAHILMALMAGKALTAGELAIRANISPQTASNHLKKLVEAHLIERLPLPTRYHYYQITLPLVAQALESLSILLPVTKQRSIAFSTNSTGFGGDFKRSFGVKRLFRFIVKKQLKQSEIMK